MCINRNGRLFLDIFLDLFLWKGYHFRNGIDKRVLCIIPSHNMPADDQFIYWCWSHLDLVAFIELSDLAHHMHHTIAQIWMSHCCKTNLSNCCRFHKHPVSIDWSHSLFTHNLKTQYFVAVSYTHLTLPTKRIV